MGSAERLGIEGVYEANAKKLPLLVYSYFLRSARSRAAHKNTCIWSGYIEEGIIANIGEMMLARREHKHASRVVGGGCQLCQVYEAGGFFFSQVVRKKFRRL